MGATASISQNPLRARERFLTKHYNIHRNVNLRSQLWKSFSKYDKNKDQHILLSDAIHALKLLKLEINEAYFENLWEEWLSTDEPRRFFFPDFITFLESGKLPVSLNQDDKPGSPLSVGSASSFVSSLRELRKIKEEQKKVAVLEKQCQEQKMRLESLERQMESKLKSKQEQRSSSTLLSRNELQASASTRTAAWSNGNPDLAGSGFAPSKETRESPVLPQQLEVPSRPSSARPSSAQCLNMPASPQKVSSILGYTLQRLGEIESNAQSKAPSDADIAEFKQLLKRTRRVLGANQSEMNTPETLIHSSRRPTHRVESGNGNLTEKVKKPDVSSSSTNSWEAAKNGNLDAIKHFVSSGFKLTTLDYFGNSCLYYSSLCGHAEVCNYILEILGGREKLSKNELERCEINALNPNIKGLFDGTKTIEEIREHMTGESDITEPDFTDYCDGVAGLFAED